MSPDALGPIYGLNLYKYTKNNPLKYTDPFGLASEEKVACKCGHCVRGEFCHCRGQDPNNSIGACVCHGIDCCHKNFTILKQGSSFNNALGAVAHGVVAHGVVAHGVVAHGVVAHGVVAHGVVGFVVGGPASPRVQGSLQAADIPFNRKVLIQTARNSKNYLGTDQFGNMWHAKLQSDGSQIWTISRNGLIRNGGINKQPKVFGLKNGLSKENL